MSRRPFRPLFWLLAQVGHRVRVVTPSAKYLASDAPKASDYDTVHVPTRHGLVRCLVYRPPGTGPEAPVVMHMHGGGFINRYPEQDAGFAGQLAKSLGAVAVLPDYDAGPTVRYPVAEEQMADVAEWITGPGHEWDQSRLILSGISAGAKFAINICQIRASGGLPAPRAVSLVVPVTDLVRADRTSPARRAVISPFVQRLVQWAYLPDAARRGEPLASPRYDPGAAALMPPTIIQTGGFDTLGPEGSELARALSAAGVVVRFHEYDEADHGLYATDAVTEVLDRAAGFFAEHL